jgi:hypothetical protein
MYSRENPLTVWVVVCVLSLTVNLLLWKVVGGGTGLLLLALCFSVSAPTVTLIRRFSERAIQEHPAPPAQEKAVGVFAVAAGILSLGAFAGAIAAGRSAEPSALAVALNLLVLYAVSALLAMALGFAARRTRVGYVGLILSSVSIVVFCSIFTASLIGRWR